MNRTLRTTAPESYPGEMQGGALRAVPSEVEPTPILLRQVRALTVSVSRIEDLVGMTDSVAVRLGGEWPVNAAEKDVPYDGSSATGELAAQLHRLDRAATRLSSVLERLRELV